MESSYLDAVAIYGETVSDMLWKNPLLYPVGHITAIQKLIVQIQEFDVEIDSLASLLKKTQKTMGGNVQVLRQNELW